MPPPAGDRAVPRAPWPGCCGASAAGRSTEANIALTNGSQTAFFYLFNLFAGRV
jgi:hypothetical protein